MAVSRVAFTALLSKIVDNRGRTCPTADIGVPLIATNCIRNELLYPAFEKVRYVSDETYANWFRGHPLPGDLIFVCKGTPGRVCMTPDPVPFCIAQDMVAIRPNPREVYPKFLLALLRSSEVQAQIGNMHVGSLIPHFKKGDFDKLILSIPERRQQEAIGDFYFEMSSLIDVNQRTNRTLEAMARALFQSWFMDFNPVRARLDGHASVGFDAHGAQDFPAAFSDSAFCLIPAGWSIGSLSDVASLERESISPAAFPDELFDHFSLPSFDDRKGPKVEAGSTIMSNKFSVSKGSVLLSKLNPHIPRIWLPQVSSVRRAVCSTEFMVLKPKPGLSREFLYSLFCSSTFASVYGTLVTGTTGSHQRIRPESVLDMRVLVPSADVVAKFTAVAKPLLDRVDHNINESRTLAELRDTLLPKLLSGELRIPVAEQLVSEA